MSCVASAKWVIWCGSGPDDPDPDRRPHPGTVDFTEACLDHVGYMLEDGREHKVVPIESVYTDEQIARAECCFVEG